MSALLRSGKFLRLVSGVARNNANNNPVSASGTPGVAGGGGALPPPGVGAADGSGLIPPVDYIGSFQAWSLQHLENALPTIGGSSSQQQEKSRDEEESAAYSLDLFGNHVTESEIQTLLRRIPQLKSKAAALAQSALVLRLCGKVLERDVENKEERTALVNQVWTTLEEEYGLEMDVSHYNALLSVYLENDHVFCPEFMQNRLRNRSVKANKETYESLLQKYSQDGDMDGANRLLRVMRDQGHSVSLSVFHSLISGHSQKGDLAKAKKIVPVMKQWDVLPTMETYLTLCRGFAKKGDIKALVESIEESELSGLKLSNTELLELVHTLSMNGHEDNVQQVLEMTSPEADGFDNAAKKMICRLISSGKDEVAFKILQRTTTSQKKIRSLRARQFLESLVKNKRPVSKLLWFAEELSRQKLISGGLELLLQTSLSQGNFPLSLKLAEIYVSDGYTLSEDHAHCLLQMAKDIGSSPLDVVTTIRAIGSNLSEKEIKETVIPHFEKYTADPEEIIDCLEQSGLQLDRFVNPLIDYLTQEGRKDAAETVAKKCVVVVNQPQLPPVAESPSASSTTSSSSSAGATSSATPPLSEQQSEQVGHVQQQQPQQAYDPQSHVALVALLDPNTQVYSWVTLTSLCDMYRQQGRFWDLEGLLASSQHHYTPQDRKLIYIHTLQSYMDHGLYDKAIYLSRQLEVEGLAFEFPEYHGMMKSFGDAFVTQQYQIIETDSATPTLIQNSGYTTNAAALTTDSQATTMPGTPMTFGSAGTIESDQTAPQDYPGQQKPQQQLARGGGSLRERQMIDRQNYFHKTLKQALQDKEVETALECYEELDGAGKRLNVTESSNLIELLIKSDMVGPATAITEQMLHRDAYPMPKIFRFLLNRLASMGEVEMVNNIGECLSPKVKKEVSFDNRLCNAYLSANRAGEFLDLLQTDLESATPANIQTIKDKFPRGGAMGLLENNPDLIDKYSKLAHEFVRHDYIAPMNVLWTYYFINGQHDKALPLWNAYVKDCPQIMFQKICQTARNEGSLVMASNLVDLLHNANVTSGAQGIAYSCLLDVESQKGDYKGGLEKLTIGINRGVQLKDVNRTALLRIKNGLEKQGESFPFEIPKKTEGSSGGSGESNRMMSLVN